MKEDGIDFANQTSNRVDEHSDFDFDNIITFLTKLMKTVIPHPVKMQ
jgi:protein-tyrosine-phosphatase